jgi:hypothetical protein
MVKKLGGGAQPLDRIIGYSPTCDGCSHLASVADIVTDPFAVHMLAKSWSFVERRPKEKALGEAG